MDPLHPQEAEVLQEVFEVEEEEVEEPGDPLHGGGHMDDGGYSMNFNMNSSRGSLPFEVAVEWEEEHLFLVEETVTEVHQGGNLCLLAEMLICPQEMMDILLKIVTQAEITQVLGIQEIMHHHQEIIHTVIMVIPVHVMIILPEAIVIEMVMVVIVIIQVIQVEAPTEIPMRAMVTHVVLHLHEGPRHLMVEAVAMMITAAHLTNMVEVMTVTQAAEVISTQVVVIRLADKKEGFLLLWKGE
ncbi:uncharacterized protein ACDL77_008564 [Rhynchocyon petersi]